MLIKAQALATVDQICDLGSMEASFFFVVVLVWFGSYFIIALVVQWDKNSAYSEGYCEDKKTKFFFHVVIYS